MLGYFREASGDNQILENKEFERWCKRNYEEIEDWFNDLIEFEEKELKEKGLMKKQTTYKKFLGIDIANEKVVYEPSLEMISFILKD